MPTKWYGSLFLIVLLGIVFIVYSRYERQHPVAGTPPTVGQKWYAALGIDVCGTLQPPIPVNTNQAKNPGLHTDGDGVIRIEPTKATDAGDNATLSRFVSEYPGLDLTSRSLTIPAEKKRTDGAKCPKDTPDAGKKAVVQIKVWSSSTAPGVNHPTITTDPASVRFADGQLITIAFVPKGSTIPKPNASAIKAMLQAIAQAGSTTTTTLPITATTTPTLTTTTAPSTSTTAAPITTTTKPTTGGQPSK